MLIMASAFAFDPFSEKRTATAAGRWLPLFDENVQLLEELFNFFQMVFQPT